MSETSSNDAIDTTVFTGVFTGGAFSLSLEQFDGPIDLLLHLVKNRELEIEKVSLATVTAQYLECIRDLTSVDFEVAGEYLVIAATLLSIKSSVLLNRPTVLSDDEENSEDDPSEELMRRLKDAESYREGAKKLGQRDILHIDVFPMPYREVEVGESDLKQHQAFMLGQAMRKLLAKVDYDQSTFVVTFDTISISERMVKILDILKGALSQCNSEPVVFEALIINNTKGDVIASFIALLEMCKRQIVNVSQRIDNDEIVVMLAGNEQNMQTQLLEEPLEDEVVSDERPAQVG